MKKSIFFTITVFTITLFCSQVASGADWVVCNKYPWRSKTIYVTAPHFNVEFTAVVNDYDGWGEAGAIWRNQDVRLYCNYPGCNRSSNIGTQIGGGVNVYIYCDTEGNAYSKAELWSW